MEKYESRIVEKVEGLVKCKNSGERRQAPIEILTEFLTCIMLKDYKMALKYCCEILTYEPNHTTVKEFYPLILQKLEMIRNNELDNSSECSGSDSSYSVTDGGSCTNDSEDTSSSDSSESDLAPQESDEDFRSQNSCTLPMRQISGKIDELSLSRTRKSDSRGVVERNVKQDSGHSRIFNTNIQS